MRRRRRPDIHRLSRKGDARRLVRALGYRDYVTDRLDRRFDLGAGVRRDAALALAFAPDSQGVDVCTALIRALGDSSAEVRRAAARALGTRREARAAPALAEAALTWREPRYEPASAEAVEALVQLPAHDSARAFVSAVLRYGGDLGRARLILLRIVEDGDRDACRYATTAATLGLSQGGGVELDRAAEVLVWLGPESVEPLLAALESSRGARLASVRALGRLRDQRSSEHLVALLVDEDADVRQAAADALGEISDPRAARWLLAATTDSDYAVRKAAVEAMQKLGGPGAVHELDPWSSASDVG